MDAMLLAWPLVTGMLVGAIMARLEPDASFHEMLHRMMEATFADDSGPRPFRLYRGFMALRPASAVAYFLGIPVGMAWMAIRLYQFMSASPPPATWSQASLNAILLALAIVFTCALHSVGMMLGFRGVRR
jgi:hypothetical protein